MGHGMGGAVAADPAAVTTTPAPCGAGEADPRSAGEPRLNVFALPTRTTLLFVMILVVILLPMAAAMVEDTPLPEWLLVGLLTLLPLRHFLRQPGEEQRRHQPNLARDYPSLAAALQNASANVGVRPAPRLIVSRQARGSAYTSGTFTRRVLVVPAEQAAELEVALASPNAARREAACAVLLHELSHFANRDVALVIFSQGLLWVTIGVMSISLVVSLLTPWLYSSTIRFYHFDALLPPAFFDTLGQLAPDVAAAVRQPPQVSASTWLRYLAFTLSAHWPLIAGAIVLYLLYWLRLVQTRELYADARVVQWQRTTWYVVDRITWGLFEAPPSNHGAGVKGLAQRRPFAPLVAWWRRRLADHPDPQTRLRCLREPQRIYGSEWSIGLTAGVAVVTLNLALASLFFSRYVRGPNATLPFVLGFVVMSLSLLPYQCVGGATGREFWGKACRIVALFTIIKLIPQSIAGGLVSVAVVVSPRLIDEAAYGLVGATGEGLPSLGIEPFWIVEMFVLRPAILFTVVMPLTLLGWLWLDSRLKGWLLACYAAPFWARRSVLIFWLATLWLAGVLAFVVLPFYNVATAPTAHSLLDPLVFLPMLATVAASLGAVALLAALARRYAYRCPSCGGVVRRPYQLGLRCPQCDAELNPWLATRYAVSVPRELVSEQ